MSTSDVISSLSRSFDDALISGDLFFFPSTITKLNDSGIEFEIRSCPALQKKPPITDLDADLSKDIERAPAGSEERDLDPFSPPYNPKLHIGDLKYRDGDEYAVLLNKYAVIPRHFLLVTKNYQSQLSPLMPPDLVQTYLLLISARNAGSQIFAFYNCGINSGASQGHKHVQFVPIENDSDGPPIEKLARSVSLETPDKPFSLTNLPYANHVIRFPTNIFSYKPEQLETHLSTAFLLLLDLCISTIRHDPDYPPGRPSYNVLITLEHMHLIPRRQDTHRLTETGEVLNINALGFAGMLLVKSDGELEAVKSEGVGKILRSVGLESIHDLQVAGTSAEAAV